MAADLEWLSELEGRVHEAAARLISLRADNTTLQARVRDLEEKLSAADPASLPGSSSWEREREQIRQRVEKLTRELERLAAG